ncbi:MAG: IS630 family transposase ISMae27 [Chroococcidiopsis cubana SAG 39.79]|uniref:IS630 family transposase n=1 Tax=Chroococcidiopsis cubana TaxID=171392 RepID=UPI002AC79753|nr:IS630 family transposase [Chroococcidiopsis cubana]MDZ4870834.1 IS630 family transposase ISMae27 [Chroococcidiopsis cubana SAG 39.79]
MVSRFGLKTIERRLLTGCGIKPIGIGQWKRENYYVYGVVEPTTGCRFFYEFSHLDTTCLQAFLDLFSQTYAQDFHILQLDNGSFHKAIDLIVPDNIILFFQPSHCPELNPIERLWQYIKSFLGWQLFDNLDELRDKVRHILNSFTPEIIVSLTGWNYILHALSVAGIS